MVPKSTEFETMTVLHNLWTEKIIETAAVIISLQKFKQLQVTSLTVGGMTAESQDGTHKYKIGK